MDEGAAAAIKEDGAENKPSDGDTAAGNNVGPSSEDTAERVFCCQDCGEAFREEAAYLEHRHHHPQANVHLDNQLDDLHDAEKDNETANFCTLCSLSFVEPSDFHLHMEKSHGQTSGKQSSATKQHTYECADCGKCYLVIGHFLNHQRSHRQASKSVFHDLEHLKKKSFQCESCGRNYSRASALDAHRRCHEEKLVKSRNRTAGDALHMEESLVEGKPSENQTDDTPSPEKTFKCSCGKAFSALMRLKTHQRFSRNSQCSPEEMKEKPKKSCNEFYCSECKKAFNGHIALFNHQRWHANHSDDSANRYPCEECGKVFMTLTFYYRHQRMAHSDETPAKSFLHQVCQLQKKAFECKDCGLKFSRASALHSHQLQHTDVFKEAEKEAQMCTALPPQQETLESDGKETEQEEAQSENVLPNSTAEENSHINETDEDVDSYDPGDFNVQVISASESEDEPVQDLNPDLELLCESDQEVRYEGDAGSSLSCLVSKSEMDLKIVQIDFDQTDEQCAPIASEAQDQTTGERFECPECFRWFSSASSLRVHRMWHGVRKRKQQTQGTECSIVCTECGLKFTNCDVFKTHLHQHALEEEEEEEEEKKEKEEAAQMENNTDPAVPLTSVRAADGENTGEDTGGDADGCDTSTSLQTNASGSTRKQFEKIHTCPVCGKIYIYWVSFKKHQQIHEKESLPKSSEYGEQSLHKYQCPECGMSFIRRARLLGHLRAHRPSQPLRCDQCNKRFTSIKSWMTHVELHKQKPFWCLRCAVGFTDEGLLNEHLQNHDLKVHKCYICQKIFHTAEQLRIHHKSHSGATPYQCTLCGKGFSQPGNLISHRRKHFLRVYTGPSGMPLGIRNSMAKKRMIKKKRFILTTFKEEPEMDTYMEELPGMEGRMEKDKTQRLCDYIEAGECAFSHHFKPSKPFCSAGSAPPEESKSKPEQPQTEQEPDNSELQEANRSFEWKCVECDMGFDEMEKLHLHYIKHATGELPLLQDDFVD